MRGSFRFHIFLTSNIAWLEGKWPSAVAVGRSVRCAPPRSYTEEPLYTGLTEEIILVQWDRWGVRQTLVIVNFARCIVIILYYCGVYWNCGEVVNHNTCRYLDGIYYYVPVYMYKSVYVHLSMIVRKGRESKGQPLLML